MNMGGVLLAMTAVAAVGSGASPLMGRWGGEHAILVVTAEGGRLSLDCGSGAFHMPDTIDANGDFAATGTLDVYAAGPTRLRAPSSASLASYRGHLEKDRLILNVTSGTPRTDRHYDLTRGRRSKIVRCL